MNQRHYKPWTVGGVSRVNVCDWLGLGVAEILYMQEHNPTMQRGILYLFILWTAGAEERTPGMVTGMKKVIG